MLLSQVKQFQTTRLTIRPIEEQDVDLFYESVQHSLHDLKPWMFWLQDDFSKEKALSFIVQARNQQYENSALQLGIFRESQFMGMLSLNMIDWPNKTADIGYWISSPERKKGLITESAEALIQFACNNFGLKNFLIRCSTKNPESQKVAVNLGFRQVCKLPGILSFPENHLGILFSKKV